MSRKEPLLDTITVYIPLTLSRRGGRKEMQLPEGATQPRQADNTLVKALARAFRWKRMLESGNFTTITELAKREQLTVSFVTRVLRLTQLSPDIVEAIVDGRQGSQVTLAAALRSVPLEWTKQRMKT